MAGRYVVKISARIIRFPRACCCCGGDDDVEHRFIAAHHRSTGVKVVRTQVQEWDFPLCGFCREWMAALRRIPDPHRTSLTIWCAIPLLIVAAILFLMGRREFQANYWPSALSCFTGFVVSIGLVVLIGRFDYRKRVARRREIKIAEGVAIGIRPDADCHPKPVRYHGWSGSVHTVSFTSKLYSELLIAANRGKVLG